MLKILLVAESIHVGQKLRASLPDNLQAWICATVVPDMMQTKVQELQPDLVLMSSGLALTTKLTNKVLPAVRDSIRASTHQGIQLVPVREVLYFQAEHKYVTAFHNRGELLIEDTLNSLEQEFAPIFVRIHRNTLVASAKIEQLVKQEDGRYYVKMVDKSNLLAVSRRQLPVVRRVLLCL